MYWFSIKEAAQELKVPRLEIERSIVSGELQGYLLCKNTRLLSFITGPDSQKIGTGIFNYSGVVRVNQTVVNELIHGGELKLERQTLDALEPERVKGYSSKNPYTRMPFAGITEWCQEVTEPTTQRCMIAPGERPSHTAVFANAAASVPSSLKSGEFGALLDTWADAPRGETQPDYSHCTPFSVADIVIIQSDLMQGMMSATHDDSGLPALPMERADLLAELLWRILTRNPEYSSKNIWHAITQEIEFGEITYDLEGILVRVEPGGIIWENRQGDEKKLSFKNMENRLSRLRKHLTN